MDTDEVALTTDASDDARREAAKRKGETEHGLIFAALPRRLPRLRSPTCVPPRWHPAEVGTTDKLLDACR